MSGPPRLRLGTAAVVLAGLAATPAGAFTQQRAAPVPEAAGPGGYSYSSALFNVTVRKSAGGGAPVRADPPPAPPEPVRQGGVLGWIDDAVSSLLGW